MNTVEVPLTEKLSAFIESEIAVGGHTSASDCILAILKDAQRKRGWEKAEKLVRAGLESGESIVVDKAFWEELHRDLRERYPEVDNP